MTGCGGGASCILLNCPVLISYTHDILPKKRLCLELYAPYAQYGLGHGSIPKRSTIYSCVVITTG
jgi:hypothetical protein